MQHIDKSIARSRKLPFRRRLLAGLALCSWTLAWSQPRLPFAPQPNEIPMLPQGCQLFINGTTDEQKNLAARSNFPGWKGISHYCAGMNFMNRARYNSKDKNEKRFNLQSAIGEFGYVLKHSPSTAPNLDQIRLQVQMAEMMLRMQK